MQVVITDMLRDVRVCSRGRSGEPSRTRMYHEIALSFQSVNSVSQFFALTRKSCMRLQQAAKKNPSLRRSTIPLLRSHSNMADGSVQASRSASVTIVPPPVTLDDPTCSVIHRGPHVHQFTARATSWLPLATTGNMPTNIKTSCLPVLVSEGIAFVDLVTDSARERFEILIWRVNR